MDEVTEQRLHARMDGHRDEIRDLDRRTTRVETRVDGVESQVGHISDTLSSLTAQHNANHGETTRQLQLISGQIGEQRGQNTARNSSFSKGIALAGLALSGIVGLAGIVATITKLVGVW